MPNAAPVQLPPGFTDAAALQVGPRSFRLAIETSSQVWHDQHGWISVRQYVLNEDRKFRKVQDAIDAAEEMREAYHVRLGFRYVRPSGSQDHRITVHMNSKMACYLSSHADQAYQLVTQGVCP